MNKICILVTGGMGFIGSTVVKKLLNLNFKVINVDKITYAANKQRIKEFDLYKNHHFYKIDILNQKN